MKRLSTGAVAIMLAALLSGPALADTLVGNTFDLSNSSPATEKVWLEKLLGGTALTFVLDVQQPAGADGKSLTNYNPGIEWDYAVVKYAGNWAAYSDSPNDNLLSVPLLSNGISHVDFFKVPGPSVSVPEPSVLLLLGVGLTVLAPVVWLRRRRV